jgi:putative transposase
MLYREQFNPDLTVTDAVVEEWISVGTFSTKEKSPPSRNRSSSGCLPKDQGVLKEADARTLRQNAFKKTKRYAERVVAAACKKDGISLTELRSGSRRGKLPAVRVKIVQGLVEDYGVPIAEVARQVGISTSGVSKILTRSLSS